MTNPVCKKTEKQSVVSTGAGIAIAGVWIACAGLSALLLMINFVWTPMTDQEVKELGGAGAFMLLLLIAAPLIVAYFVTKLALNKEG